MIAILDLTIGSLSLFTNKCKMLHCNLKVGSHDPISIQLVLKIFVCVMELVGVHTIEFFDPIIRDELENFNNSCFENFMPTSPQLDPAVAAIL